MQGALNAQVTIVHKMTSSYQGRREPKSPPLCRNNRSIAFQRHPRILIWRVSSMSCWIWKELERGAWHLSLHRESRLSNSNEDSWLFFKFDQCQRWYKSLLWYVAKTGQDYTAFGEITATNGVVCRALSLNSEVHSSVWVKSLSAAVPYVLQ